MNANQIVTSKIISKIESGQMLYWSSAFRSIKRNVKRHNNYSFLNQFLLAGNTSEYFLSAKQAQELGLSYKGTSGKWETVTFWKIMKSIDKETNKEKTIPLLRYFQVVGLDDIEQSEVKEKLIKKLYGEKKERKADIDTFLAKSGIELKMNGNAEAYYSPTLNYISLAKIENARSVNRYYKTLFHEMIHATGHATKLDRFSKGNNRFGSEAYSKEELVAEIGSAMLAHYFGINDEENEMNTASYCANWLNALKGDSNMLISASSQAEKAVKYLLKVSGLETDDNETDGE